MYTVKSTISKVVPFNSAITSGGHGFVSQVIMFIFQFVDFQQLSI